MQWVKSLFRGYSGRGVVLTVHSPPPPSSVEVVKGLGLYLPPLCACIGKSWDDIYYFGKYGVWA